MKKTVDYYMSLPYTIEIIKNDDGSYFCKIKEFKGCMTEADSLEEAVKMIEEAKILWLSAAIEDDVDIPLPEHSDENNYSGKILLRLPKYLHKKLVDNAKNENVNLNYYIATLLAEKNKEFEIYKNSASEIFDDCDYYNKFNKEKMKFKIKSNLKLVA